MANDNRTLDEIHTSMDKGLREAAEAAKGIGECVAAICADYKKTKRPEVAPPMPIANIVDELGLHLEKLGEKAEAYEGILGDESAMFRTGISTQRDVDEKVKTIDEVQQKITYAIEILESI